MIILQQNLICSPLEQFEVTNLISIYAPIFGYLHLSLTNLGLYAIISISLVILLHLLANNHFTIIPSKWSIALDTIFASLSSIVREQVGTTNEIFLPFLYSLFCFILTANLIAIVPYNFAITTSAIVCLGFSFIIWLSVTILSLSIHKLHFFSYFIPAGCPVALIPLLVLIELISYVARAGSLGLRLFANLISGHTLLKILATFLYKLFGTSLIIAILTLIPFGLFLAITILEVAVAFIQAFVFTLLTASYIKDAIDLH